jgi:hypothetical protein
MQLAEGRKTAALVLAPRCCTQSAVLVPCAQLWLKAIAIREAVAPLHTQNTNPEVVILLNNLGDTPGVHTLTVDSNHHGDHRYAGRRAEEAMEEQAAARVSRTEFGNDCAQCSHDLERAHGCDSL